MNHFPLISIVTPSFNQARFIGEAMASVQLQNYNNYEHIIIDGMSSDETVDILRNLTPLTAAKEQPRIFWTSELDSGQSEALNKGFRRAKGEIIGWLNSDDRYRPHCFECVVQAFKDNPEIDIVYGDYLLVNELGETLKKFAVRLNSMHSFSDTIVFFISQQPQRFFDAEYLRKTTGSMKGFNTRWISSFSYAYRSAATALCIFLKSSPILDFNLTVKRVALRTDNERNINKSFSQLLHFSVI
jgi:glycosyltransferase involved in cell wall biosynthesis